MRTEAAVAAPPEIVTKRVRHRLTRQVAHIPMRVEQARGKDRTGILPQLDPLPHAPRQLQRNGPVQQPRRLTQHRRPPQRQKRPAERGRHAPGPAGLHRLHPAQQPLVRVTMLGQLRERHSVRRLLVAGLCHQACRVRHQGGGVCLGRCQVVFQGADPPAVLHGPGRCGLRFGPEGIERCGCGGRFGPHGVTGRDVLLGGGGQSLVRPSQLLTKLVELACDRLGVGPRGTGFATGLIELLAQRVRQVDVGGVDVDAADVFVDRRIGGDRQCIKRPRQPG